MRPMYSYTLAFLALKVVGCRHQQGKHVSGEALNVYSSWELFYFINYNFSLFYSYKFYAVQKIWWEVLTSVSKNRARKGGGGDFVCPGPQKIYRRCCLKPNKYFIESNDICKNYPANVVIIGIPSSLVSLFLTFAYSHNLLHG
jgi:hypothetical protein